MPGVNKPREASMPQEVAATLDDDQKTEDHPEEMAAGALAAEASAPEVIDEEVEEEEEDEERPWEKQAKEGDDIVPGASASEKADDFFDKLSGKMDEMIPGESGGLEGKDPGDFLSLGGMTAGVGDIFKTVFGGLKDMVSGAVHETTDFASKAAEAGSKAGSKREREETPEDEERSSKRMK
ncbi:MAG: hypothetical protein AB7F64_00535 [Gammaproteobacteria bacterium]